MAQKTLIYIILIFVILAIVYIPGFMKLQELKSRNRDLEKKIAALKTQNQALQTEKVRLEKDLTYLEKVAREKMGLKREGEKVYKVVPE